MAEDERYKTNAGRVVNRATLIPPMMEMTAKLARADLLARLEAAGVPGGPINTLEDVFADPQVLARKMRIDLPSQFAKGGSIPGVRSPITINGVRMAADRAPPVPRLLRGEGGERKRAG
jgi:crotonobetainyl-CoA:carnitine CoA-transferase CaiB-like acyl-CoA transferase